MIPHLLSGWGLNLSDRLVIAAYLGLAVAGVYSFGYQIASIGMVLTTEINRALLPRYGRAITNKSERGALLRVITLQRLSTFLICANVGGCPEFRGTSVAAR